MKLPFDGDSQENHTLVEVKRSFPDVRYVVDLSHHCLSTYNDEVPGLQHTKLLLQVSEPFGLFACVESGTIASRLQSVAFTLCC